LISATSQRCFWSQVSRFGHSCYPSCYPDMRRIRHTGVHNQRRFESLPFIETK
jgi:hypothetical protein